ncbi:MAG: hypothetical protein Q8P89_02905 [bacterium]|nr:hypothetical protein [bacterium]
MAIHKPVQSRLAHKETQQAFKQLVLTSLGIILLLVFIIFAGIPALVKFSAFLGDVKTSGQPINPSDENSPLLPPRLESLPDATKDRQITLTGFAQPGKEIEVLINNEPAGKTTVGSDGKFLLSNLTLTEGENRIRAYTVEGETKSEPSQTIFITYKKGSPRLEVSKPEEGTSFSGDDKTIRIEGQTDPDMVVTVNDRWAIVSSTGSFYASYTLSDGENILKVRAVDEAGNETTLERKVTYSP